MMNRLTRAKMLACLGLGLVAFLFLSGCDFDDLVAPRAESTEVKTATFALEGVPTVMIETSNGAVTVRGVEGRNDVQVTATLSARGDTLEEANKKLEKMVVFMFQDGNRVTLRFRPTEQPTDARKHTSVEFDILVPIHGDIDIDTSNGEVTVTDVVGTVAVETSNGKIDIDHVVGSIRLDTSNGAINMSDVDGLIDAETSNGAIVFRGHLLGELHRMRTSNGAIGVAIPQDLALRIDASTSNGSISTSLPLIGDTEGKSWSATLNPPSASTLDLRTSNGSIRIEGLP
jgi:DUF4097 and DUF4098 domain-containing protein YvlB